MRKIVDSLLYDTDKAVCIAADGCCDSSPLYFTIVTKEKKLYMTKKGRFFFYTNKHVDDIMFDHVNEDIIPCTEKEAREFCLKHSPHNFNALWGRKIEDA